MSSEGIPSERKIDFIIFGGTGDLSRKKLLPAIDRIKEKVNLGRVFILGRKKKKFEEIKSKVSENLKEKLNFVEFNVSDEESYKKLGKLLNKDVLNVFYLALPPYLFREALEGIGKFLNVPLKRIVIEKPYGLNLNDARELNDIVKRYFREEEIYRIDHFLGKPQVQNILSFKFSNPVFYGLLNRHYVEEVFVLALEREGVEGREAYYDRVGAIRDMVQNHMLMLSAFTAMELPSSPEEFHNEIKRTLKFFEFVRESLRRGKYKSYRGDVETFVHVRLSVKNERWEGVPFHIITGKKLREKRTEISIRFKNLKSLEGIIGCVPKENILTFNIYPENAVSFSVNLISPYGFLSCAQSKEWKLYLKEALGEIPDAYESLLLDVIEGDRTLFLDGEEAELLWKITEPLLEQAQKVPLEVYEDYWSPENNLNLFNLKNS
ncbi:glucose-6-phosphate dehydrogenase (NADP(+)) [Aquifex pyrophilus]